MLHSLNRHVQCVSCYFPLYIEQNKIWEKDDVEVITLMNWGNKVKREGRSKGCHRYEILSGNQCGASTCFKKSATDWVAYCCFISDHKINVSLWFVFNLSFDAWKAMRSVFNELASKDLFRNHIKVVCALTLEKGWNNFFHEKINVQTEKVVSFTIPVVCLIISKHPHATLAISRCGYIHYSLVTFHSVELQNLNAFVCSA